MSPPRSVGLLRDPHRDGSQREHANVGSVLARRSRGLAILDGLDALLPVTFAGTRPHWWYGPDRSLEMSS